MNFHFRVMMNLDVYKYVEQTMKTRNLMCFSLMPVNGNEQSSCSGDRTLCGGSDDGRRKSNCTTICRGGEEVGVDKWADQKLNVNGGICWFSIAACNLL